MSFETTDLTPSIGTRIEVDVADLISGKYAEEIRALLRKRAILVFPGAHVTDAEQVAFSKTLGNFALEDGYDEKGSETYRISLCSASSRAWHESSPLFMRRAGSTASACCARRSSAGAPSR